MRLVSLVPSTTETLFALGVGSSVVGRTAFCVRPAEAREVPQVGGTKTPDLDRIASLQPDLILTNAEENRAADVAGLTRLAPVVSFYPRRVEDALADLVMLGGLVGRWDAGQSFAAQGHAALQDLRRRARPFRFACLVWAKPWMAVAGATYMDDLLHQAGGMNIYADAPARYPAIEPADLFARSPDLVLLPDEPFPFAPRHVAALAALAPDPSHWRPRLRLVDGQLLSWHGVRLIEGLKYVIDITYRESRQDLQD